MQAMMHQYCKTKHYQKVLISKAFTMMQRAVLVPNNAIMQNHPPFRGGLQHCK